MRLFNFCEKVVIMKCIRFLSLAIIFAVLSAPLLQAAVTAGDPAPDFKLPDARGIAHSLSDFKDKYVVLEWVNPDCPFVKKHYSSGNMQKLQQTYTGKGVVWLSIASSGPGLQGYYKGKAWRKITKKEKAQPSAVLLDPAGSVGRLYGAQTTPHVFIINPTGQIIYAGAIDSTPSPHAEDIAGSVNYVAQALDEAMSGKPVSTPAVKSYGCSVKYAA